MKTLTELSGSLIRVAAAAIAEAKRSLPTDEQPAGSSVVEAPAQDQPVISGDAAVEAPAPAEAPAAGEPAGVEGDAAKAHVDAAVASATGLSAERLAMARGAVEAAGGRVHDVRLVRVLALDEEVAGSKAIGAYRYLVDFFPASMKQERGSQKDEHGRRGGGRGGARGGGKRGAPAGATGGFSMDSLRDDRKSERGGGRERPGGRPGGRGAGRPPGGTPKK
jgi:hypothetical protein